MVWPPPSSVTRTEWLEVELRGRTHYDLEPENVLFDSSGNPGIADFGPAKEVSVEQELTETGEVLGTPSYMAPEQVQGEGSADPAPPQDDGRGPATGEPHSTVHGRCRVS